MDLEARNFLRDNLGIVSVSTSRLNDTNGLQDKSKQKKPWTCLSCLLTQVYEIFCKAGPEGDAAFFREIEHTKFERVSTLSAQEVRRQQQ